MVERTTLNRVVAGSIPAVGVICVDSSMVRIRAFQARGPGSIPGRRMSCVFCFVSLIYIFRDGVVGNISACHADARGSIPRSGVLYHQTKEVLVSCTVETLWPSWLRRRFVIPLVHLSQVQVLPFLFKLLCRCAVLN